MQLWILSTCCYLLATQGVMIPQEKLTTQEAFFLRRVTEFWKDHDYSLVKKQIDEFLMAHESSNIHNNLYALMGDILYQECDYTEALAMYNRISDPLLIEKTISRRSQCLYLAGQYDEVIETVSLLLSSPSDQKIDYADEMRFILGDSFFRKMRMTSDSSALQELALKAKPLLLSLLNTTYQDKVLLPLAEIHRELKELEEASPLYLALAEKFPLQKEDLLLQAAALQLEFDPLLALTTFQRVVDIGGAKASDAAYQELLLLFQNDRFSDLIGRAPKLQATLGTDKKPLFEFCLARSYFKLEQLPEAIEHFTLFVGQEPENTLHKRAAFLTLIHCAQKTDNASLFDQIMGQFLTAFPHDEEAGKVLLLHAQTALQKGNVEEASHDLNRLLSDFPDFPDQETLLYDQALLLSKTQQWDVSRSAFIAYLNRFPSTPHLNLIWPSIVHCSIQELKNAVEEKVQEKKELLASDLGQALAVSNLFSLDEEASYQFLLGQLMFDLHHFTEALSELDRFCERYPQHPSLSEAYLLIVLGHRELKSEPAVFIPAAERALAFSENQTHQAALRLQLFNAYLSLKEYDQAAEHLYETFIINGNPVQQENQLWLANHYLKKMETGDQSFREKIIILFKKVLYVDDSFAIHFDPSQTYLETEALKFADLLPPIERERVLRSLIGLQASHETFPWKLQARATLELGKTYLGLKQTDDALKKFEELIAQEEKVSASIRNAALLEKSRILLAGCDKTENDPTLRSIMSMLKDLQIQKELAQEPTHLEAALDYADLRTSLAPAESRIESALFFLNRVKEDFNSKDDPINYEYHESRLRFPEKDHLFQIYMKDLEAEILHWEVKEALQNNDIEKAEHSKKVATMLFEEIIQDHQATAYLKQRAEAKLTELRM